MADSWFDAEMKRADDWRRHSWIESQFAFVSEIFYAAPDGRLVIDEPIDREG